MKAYSLTLELKSVNKSVLVIYSTFLKNIFNKLNLDFKIIFLPTLKKKFTLLRSPHVHKKSREQFEFTRYKQIIYISNSNINFLKYLIINKPSDIKLNVKQILKRK